MNIQTKKMLMKYPGLHQAQHPHTPMTYNDFCNEMEESNSQHLLYITQYICMYYCG